MPALRVLLITALLALAVAGVARADVTDFGIDSVSASLSTTQAGAHPDVTTTFNLKVDPSTQAAYAPLRDGAVELPPGLIGDPTKFPTCPTALFASFTNLNSPSCPFDTQVGIVNVTTYWFGSVVITVPEPLYNLPAPAGSPARLGFIGILYPVVIDFKVRSDGDYGLTAAALGATASSAAPINAIQTVTWGVPADPSHDALRITPADALFAALGGGAATAHSSNLPPVPFMSNSTSCAPSTVGFDITAYPLGGQHFTASTPLPTLTGCDAVPFDPTISVAPTSSAAHAAAGLSFDLTVPQDGLDQPNGLRSADLKKAVVTLPEGMTINPSSAHGLDACSESQVGLVQENPPRFNLDEPQCPDASKVGAVQIDTPLLHDPLKGSLYLAKQSENPFHSLLSGYLVAEGDGVLIKLAGRFDLDPDTGRVQAIFDNNPQQPFSRLHLEFFGGPHGPLTNPGCGTQTATAQLDAWSGASVQRTSTFTIDQGCSAPQFKPQADAGLANPVAGSSSAFSLRIARTEADSELRTVSTQLPPGLLAKIAGVPRCSAADANAGACPAASQIGHVDAGAGSGPDPFFIQGGKVFLTDGYKGAPFGLLVQVPAVAGPFNLGMVNVRAALAIDPTDAHATVNADPMPRILQGIPLDVRDLRVVIDRPGFMQAPTSCNPMTIQTTVSSWAGDSVQLPSRFQVGDCQDLGFSPKLKIALSGKGKTRSGDHPTLTATVTEPSGQANIRRAKVALPLSLALDPNNSQHVCNYQVAQAVHGGTVGCPASTIVGTATAVTPLLSQPLAGPVYLVQGLRFGAHGQAIHTLPSLLIPLRGQIALDLRAQSAVSGGKLVTTFATIPDAPVSKFTLKINGGRKGILVITGRGKSICGKKQVSNATFGAQSGKSASIKPTLSTPCGKPAHLRVLSRRVTGGALVLRVKTSQRGRLTVTGAGVRPVSRVLSAGEHSVRVGLNGRRVRVMKVNVKLAPANARPAQATFSIRR